MNSDNDLPSSPSSTASSPFLSQVVDQEEDLSSPPVSPSVDDDAEGDNVSATSGLEDEAEEDDDAEENETVASIGRESVDNEDDIDDDGDSLRRTPTFFPPTTRKLSIPSPSPATALAHSPSESIYQQEVSRRLNSLLSSRPSLHPPKSYSIEMILAIPHACQIHSLAVTSCSSHIFSGGSDGFVRRYDLFDSLNGLGADNDRNLTMKQGGVHADNNVLLVAGAGPAGAPGRIGPQPMMPVLVGYWENEEWSRDETPYPANGRKKEEFEINVKEMDDPSPQTPNGTSQFLSPNSQIASPTSPLMNGIQLPNATDGGSPGHEPDTSPGPTKEERIATLAAKYQIPWGPKAFSYSIREPSPVYSLAIQNEELWGLSGTEMGNINLFTIRHDEGQTRHVFRPDLPQPFLSHRPLPISVLTLHSSEKGFFSGGWDGRIFDWDLEKVAEDYAPVRGYEGHRGQISSVELRPFGVSANDHDWDEEDADAEGEDEWSDGRTFGSNDRKRKRDIDDENYARVPVKKPEVVVSRATEETSKAKEEDEDSNGSYDPLFDDDEEDPKSDKPAPSSPFLHLPGQQAPHQNSNDVTSPINGNKPDPSRLSQSTPRLTTRKPSRVTGPTSSIPTIVSPSLPALSQDVILSSSIDGTVLIHDRRIPSSVNGGVRRLPVSTPWCASATWGVNGQEIFVGRRNSSIEIFDIRQTGRRGLRAKENEGLVNILRMPASSGIVSCVKVTPDGNHLLSASFDNVRLWNLKNVEDGFSGGVAQIGKGKVPFKIIAGHHGGFISHMYVDPTCRYFITASGNRGWEGATTENVLVHEMKAIY